MLKVQLLGDFALYDGNELLHSGYSRKNRAIYLLQFLLAHRGEGFSKDALIQLLYKDEESDNPVNALKIIVHRLRKFLDSIGMKPGHYVLNSKGKYSFNKNIPCEVDTEIFDAAIQKAEKEDTPDDKKLELLCRAINLYKGDFLPDLTNEDWVASRSVSYQNKYHEAVQKASAMLDSREDYKRMLEITSRAAELFPYDEKIQTLNIYSLYKNRFTREAIEAYDQTVEMLYDEFGVSPGDELKDLYRLLSEEISDVTDNVTYIKDHIKETEAEQGAYYSNLQHFIDSFKLMVRTMERTGFSAFLMLCTLEGYKSAEFLKEAIKSSLRKSDSFSRYSPNQYIILLMGTNLDNCDMVFKRIKSKYEKLAGKNANDLEYSVVSAIDTQWIDKETE